MSFEMIRRTAVPVAALAVVMAMPMTAAAQHAAAPATPKELVATYDALADSILAGIKSERKLVLAILGSTYGHAQAELGRARQALAKGDAAAATTAVQNVATAVGQIATEGDNSVSAIRKRLLEGGHHANSEGEAQGIYEEGYVIVTKVAKKAFLESSQLISMTSKKPTAEALDTEWKKVEAAWTQHIASAK
jgi:hypothetical protein